MLDFLAPHGQELSGQTSGVAYVLLGTAGLLGMIALVTGAYLAATRQNPWARRGQQVPVERRFVHSLLPIAVGYTVAHYFSLVVFQGQAGYLLASDPLGRGWDLFGTAGSKINYLAVSTSVIALVQVAAILTGHVVGFFIAHDRAIAQYPLLVVMVTYTLGGIALLLGASPVRPRRRPRGWLTNSAGGRSSAGELSSAEASTAMSRMTPVRVMRSAAKRRAGTDTPTEATRSLSAPQRTGTAMQQEPVANSCRSKASPVSRTVRRCWARASGVAMVAEV
jgi:hypothetical protein